MFSGKRDNWQTPPDLFAKLHAEFGLLVDVAASAENRLCLDYFGPDNPAHPDALNERWSRYGSLSRCWCNPPYSRGLQAKFIAKAATERLNGVTTVMLLPARTDTIAFHRHIWNRYEHGPKDGVEVRFLKGRLTFVGAKDPAPFPSMIIVFRGADSRRDPR